MNLWVRSQDKRILQKVDNVFLDANYENKKDNVLRRMMKKLWKI